MATKEAREGLQDMFKKRARELGSLSMDSMVSASPFNRSKTAAALSTSGSAGLGSASYMSTSGFNRRSAVKTTEEKLIFKDVDRKAAVKLVQRGQKLCLSADTGSNYWWSARPKHLLSKLRSKRTYHFVVTESRAGHYELRWDIDPEKAPSQNSYGRLALSDIRDVAATTIQDGEDADEDVVHNRKFRVFYGTHHLKLMAPDRYAMKEWTVALMHLARQNRGSAMRTQSHSVDGNLRGYIESVFNSLDLGNSKTMRSEQLSDWLFKLNISADDDYVHDIMLEFDKDKTSNFNLDEFTELFHLLTVKEALVPWFEKYAVVQIDGNAPTDMMSMHRAMSAERFQLFLELEQSENYFFSSHPILKGKDGLFETLPPPFTEIIAGNRVLTLAGFSRLMCSAENSIFDPERRARVGQDMTRPLSHYWIASSHNTYLEGHQLVGTSSLEQYIDVLLRGCRCVEIDCWDGDDGDPIVTHGWTATSKLRFKDVINVCRDYAFVASVYPLILSLEVHCSTKQQDRMGEILGEALGDTLLRPEPGCTPEGTALLSPEGSKLKIIVKAKQPDHRHRKSEYSAEKPPMLRRCFKTIKNCICCRCRTRRQSVEDAMMGMQSTPSEIQNTASLDSNDNSGLSDQAISQTCLGSVGFDRMGSGTGSGSSARYPMEIAPIYKKTIYLSGQSLKKDDVAISEAFGQGAIPCPCTCVSLNDQRATYLMDKQLHHVVAIQKVFRDQLIRVYPHKHRVGSGNYNPFDMWLSGVSMVALNYQNLDLHIICNEGLFLNENGGSGYILKPQLVRGAKVPEETSGQSVPATTTQLTPRKGEKKNTYDRKTLDDLGNRKASWRKNLGKPTSISHSDSNLARKMQMLSKTAESVEHSPRSRQDREDAAGVGHNCILELTILSGHSLPKLAGKEEINPLVRVSICGAHEDRRSAETWRVVDNGFNPRWHQLFSFHVAEPTLSLLVFEVINVKVGLRKGNREFLAAAALPFTGLREGIRWVPLLDSKHHPIDLCGLLVEVRIRGSWAELRRRQRLLRPVVPSSIAQIVARGHGGLDSNEGSLTRQSDTARRRVSADSGEGTSRFTQVVGGSSEGSCPSGASIDEIVKKHPMLKRSGTAGFAGKARTSTSTPMSASLSLSTQQSKQSRGGVSGSGFAAGPSRHTESPGSVDSSARADHINSLLESNVISPDLLVPDAWRTPREPKVSLSPQPSRGATTPPLPASEQEEVLQTPRLDD